MTKKQRPAGHVQAPICTLSIWHDGQELCADVSKITEAERQAIKAVLAPRIPAAMAILRQALDEQALKKIEKSIGIEEEKQAP